MKKENRILKAQEFQFLINNGTKIVTPSFVIFCAPRRKDHARCGISVPKKSGHAVDRNLYKRQTRMMCDELLDFETCPFDAILIIRMRYKEMTYAANKINLEKGLIKAKMISL